MAWTIEYLSSTRRQLRKLAPEVRQRVVRFMGDRIACLDDVYSIGQALTGTWSGHWKYRVGDYRVICLLRKEHIQVLVVKVGHRSSVYDQGPTAEMILLKGGSAPVDDRKDES